MRKKFDPNSLRTIDVCEILDCTSRAVHRLADTGKLPCIWIATKRPERRFKLSEVLAFKQSWTKQTPVNPPSKDEIAAAIAELHQAWTDEKRIKRKATLEYSFGGTDCPATE